jgi:hypothetical protein
VGYNGRVFVCCGIQQRRFSSVVGYNRRGFFPLWDTTENNLKMANKFFSIVSHNAGNVSSVVSYTITESYAVYCIPEKSSALYPTMPEVFFRVSHNGRYFPPLWDTTEEVFFRCGIQQKKLSSIVGYNGRGFFHFGIQRKRFFPLWDTVEKNHTTENDILNFKCLSLPSNQNLRKICYLNS